MRLKVHICCQIQRTSASYRYVNTEPFEFQRNCNIPSQSKILNRTYLSYYSSSVGNSILIKLHICCQIPRSSAGFSYVNCEPSQMQRNCSFADYVLIIQITVSPFWCEAISTVPFALCSTFVYKDSVHLSVCAVSNLLALSDQAYSEYCRFRIKYINQRMPDHNADTNAIRCALNSPFVAKYNAFQQVSAVSTLSTLRSGVFPVLQIQS